MNPFEQGWNGGLLTEAERSSQSRVVWPQGSMASDAVYPLLHEINPQPSGREVYPFAANEVQRSASSGSFPTTQANEMTEASDWLRAKGQPGLTEAERESQQRPWLAMTEGRSAEGIPLWPQGSRASDAVYPLWAELCPEPPSDVVYPFMAGLNPSVTNMRSTNATQSLWGIAQNNKANPIISEQASCCNCKQELRVFNENNQQAIQDAEPVYINHPIYESDNPIILGHEIYNVYPGVKIDNTIVDDSEKLDKSAFRGRAALNRLKSLFAKKPKMANPVKEIELFLTSQGYFRVAKTIEILVSSRGSYRWSDYFSWDVSVQQSLYQKFKEIYDIWSILLTKEWEISYEYIANRFRMNPDHHEFTLQEVQEFHLLHVAHAIFLEMFGLVPWSLLEFSKDSLERIFSGKYTFIDKNNNIHQNLSKIKLDTKFYFGRQERGYPFFVEVYAIQCYSIESADADVYTEI